MRVELLARDIATTKGSFYWHFSNRRALVDAVMARWEAEQTEAMIAAAEHGGDALSRLRLLFSAVAADASRRRGETTLYASANDEGVGDIVGRVSRRRIDYLATTLGELGFDTDEARRRSAIALAAVVGLQQLTVVAGYALDGIESDALTATALAMTTTAP